MESINKLSTADSDHGRFRAHGLVEVTIDENFARSEAWGPFNDEFVQAYATVKKQVIKEMHSKGRWVHLVTFHRSALTSQLTLDFYAIYLKPVQRNLMHPLPQRSWLPKASKTQCSCHLYLPSVIKMQVFNLKRLQTARMPKHGSLQR